MYTHDIICILGGGLTHLLFFTPTWEKWSTLTNFCQLGWNQHIFADMSKTDSLLYILRITFGLPNLGRSFSPEPSQTRLWELKLWLYTLRKIHDEFVVRGDPQKIEMLRLLTRIPRDFPRFPMISPGISPWFPAISFLAWPSQMFHPNIYNNGEICLDILQVLFPPQSTPSGWDVWDVVMPCLLVLGFKQIGNTRRFRSVKQFKLKLHF